MLQSLSSHYDILILIMRKFSQRKYFLSNKKKQLTDLHKNLLTKLYRMLINDIYQTHHINIIEIPEFKTLIYTQKKKEFGDFFPFIS